MLCVRYFPTTWAGGELKRLRSRSSFFLEWGATFGTEKCLGCICYGSWFGNGIWYNWYWYFGIGIGIGIGILVSLWRGIRKKKTLSLDSSFREREREIETEIKRAKMRKRERKKLVHLFSLKLTIN